MTAVHWHLVLNHIPILGTLFGLLVMLGSYISKNSSVRRVGLIVFVFTALAAEPAYISGEGAEEVVEHLPGSDHELIEAHEEAAEWAIYTCNALGLLALLALLLEARKRSLSSKLSHLTLLLAFIVFGQMVQVGLSGGKIRHTELESAAIRSAE